MDDARQAGTKTSHQRRRCLRKRLGMAANRACGPFKRSLESPPGGELMICVNRPSLRSNDNSLCQALPVATAAADTPQRGLRRLG